MQFSAALSRAAVLVVAVSVLVSCESSIPDRGRSVVFWNNDGVLSTRFASCSGIIEVDYSLADGTVLQEWQSATAKKSGAFTAGRASEGWRHTVNRPVGNSRLTVHYLGPNNRFIGSNEAAGRKPSWATTGIGYVEDPNGEPKRLFLVEVAAADYLTLTCTQ